MLRSSRFSISRSSESAGNSMAIARRLLLISDVEVFTAVHCHLADRSIVTAAVLPFISRLEKIHRPRFINNPLKVFAEGNSHVKTFLHISSLPCSVYQISAQAVDRGDGQDNV